jgi:aromatic-L-amino-acid/L-tryptophan decarboxylase
MDPEQFRRHGHDVVDWIADYLRDVDQYPVLPDCSPGDISSQLPSTAPAKGESMDTILADFREIIMPGVTHWNHPRFFAYFNANNSGPSILGEMLSAALGVNAMVWQSCPAATELEEVVMVWLRDLIGLSKSFTGVIQDTASTSTICALLCARERATQFRFNAAGAAGEPQAGALRIYTSREAHSSVVKGARIAGLGGDNVVLIDVDEQFAMKPEALIGCIEADVAAGKRPCCVVATIGTTSSTAIDPLEPIAAVAERFGLWLHVDAAHAGSAAILPEKRSIFTGIEQADSYVFNPHKWLFTNFDCSAYFCRDTRLLRSVFSITPEYLKTGADDQATNYRDWGIPLGRRFRALKLWFVLRYFGRHGLREKIAGHLALTEECRGWIEDHPNFEILAPVPFNTICFRFNPGGLEDSQLDGINHSLMDELNATGTLFLTHTRLAGRFCLRLNIGQTQIRPEDTRIAWEAITSARTVAGHNRV